MRRHLQISRDAEMITRPDSVDRFVQNSLAVSDSQRWPVNTASDHDVVDPSAEFERHLSGAYQRVGRREGGAGIGRMRGLPGIQVRDAESVQGLPACPEPHTRRIGAVVEIAEDEYMSIPTGNELLDESRTGDGLELPFPGVPELIRGSVVNYDRQSERLRQFQLSNNGQRGGHPRRDCQIYFVCDAERPPACEHRPDLIFGQSAVCPPVAKSRYS
jgi:hypothetical protein